MKGEIKKPRKKELRKLRQKGKTIKIKKEEK